MAPIDLETFGCNRLHFPIRRHGGIGVLLAERDWAEYIDERMDRGMSTDLSNLDHSAFLLGDCDNK